MARRRSGWLWLAAAAAALLLALVVVSPFYLVRIGALRGWAINRTGITSLLAGQQRLRVHRVAHFGLRSVRLEDVRIERLQDGAWDTWARIGLLEASWQPADFLARRIHVTRLAVDSLRVDVPLMPSPVLAPPPEKNAEQAAQATAKALNLPPIQCPRFTLDHVLVQAAHGRRLTGSVEIRDLRHENGKVSGRLHSSEWKAWPESLSLALEGGLLTGTLVQTFAVDSLRVRSEGLEAGLQGRWTKAALDPATPDTSRFEGRLVIDRWRPQDLAVLRRARLPLQPQDEVRGVSSSRPRWSREKRLACRRRWTSRGCSSVTDWTRSWCRRPAPRKPPT